VDERADDEHLVCNSNRIVKGLKQWGTGGKAPQVAASRTQFIGRIPPGLRANEI